MLQLLNRESFFEKVQSCASYKAISLGGGATRFITVHFKRDKVGEPTEIVDMWECDEGMPFCPRGFAAAVVEPASKPSDTLSILWQLAHGGH